VVGVVAPQPSGVRRVGLYWIYVGLLSIVSIFWLAVVSPIIRPTLPTNPAHLLFCIFAGIAIADAAAHAIDDIAGIWKPHDLGGALTPRQKFSPGKLLRDDIRSMLAHVTAVPVIAGMAYAYTLLPARIEDKASWSGISCRRAFSAGSTCLRSSSVRMRRRRCSRV
jgi:hypothetical protein